MLTIATIKVTTPKSLVVKALVEHNVNVTYQTAYLAIESFRKESGLKFDDSYALLA